MKKLSLLLAIFFTLSVVTGACSNREESIAFVEGTPESLETMETLSSSSSIILPPPQGSFYHGVFPGGTNGQESFLPPKNLDSYEETIGKTAAWVYFSNNWFEGRDFPLETATWIREKGSVPYIRIMMWSEWVQGQAEPLFTHQAIIDGDFDSDLRAWCTCCA